MAEESQDEESSLRDYWKKRGVTKKEGKKKRERKKKKNERKGKEEADGTDQDSESTLDGAQLDPTKLTTLTSRHENPLETYLRIEIQTALHLIWRESPPHLNKAIHLWHFKTMR